jgi:photosystem II stability/assembly factor-like uncharacterized protein
VSGVYRLRAGATTWEAVSSGISSLNNIRTLGISAGDVVFAGTVAAGVWRSMDNGATWTAMNTGLGGSQVESLAFDPNQALYAGVEGVGIFRVRANENTWENISSGLLDPAQTVGAFAFDSEGFAYSAVGSLVYRSTLPLTR